MTLLLISPSPFFLEQVEVEIATRMPLLKVIGKCYTLQDGIRAMEVLRPDMVLLDGDMEKWAALPDFFIVSSRFILLVLSADEETRRLWSEAEALVMDKPFEAEALVRLLVKR